LGIVFSDFVFLIIKPGFLLKRSAQTSILTEVKEKKERELVLRTDYSNTKSRQ